MDRLPGKRAMTFGNWRRLGPASSLQDRPPSILHIFKVYLPDIEGGIPNVIRNLTGGLAGYCRSMVLATRRPNTVRRVVVDDIPVQRSMSLGTLFSMPLAPFYPVRFWVKARRADIVDYHAPFPLIDVAISLFLPKRCALVIHWHSDIVAQRWLLPVVKGFIRRTIRRADRIIVSHGQMIETSEFLRPAAGKCVVVPFGTEQGYWTELSRDQRTRVEELRRRHPRLVVTTGRLVPYKGFRYLIDAVAAVDCQCIIIGEGVLQTALARQIQSLGLTGRVHLAGRVDRDDLKCLLHASKVFVMPSVSCSETFAIAQMEAMACGKPVINTDLPTGVPWVARHGKEAITVPPGDSALLARAIAGLFENDALREDLGTAAQRRVRDAFPLADFIARTHQIYRDALAARRGRGFP
jgi:rhamnosyl/mannosyltransferase